MIKIHQNKIFYFVTFLLVLFGVYLSYIGGYGSDEDTLPMIGTFEAILNSGAIMTSRFTGYPVAEFGIGFLSHYFGSFYANIVTFLLLIISLIFIYLTFSLNKFNSKNLLPIFLVLCLSNPIIFFENLEPIDYSWSLAPFALGCFFYKKKQYELSLLFFCISIGARLNFALFIIFFVIFFKENENFNFKKKAIFLFCCIFFGCLFYLPTWYTFKFTFDWVSAARPLEQGYYGLFARFSYKIIHLFTILSFILILIYMFNKKILIRLLNDKLILSLFVSNLLLFLWIPAELSYVLLGLILFYFFLIKNLSTKKILFIILLNFSTWLVQFDFLEVKYRDYVDHCSSSFAVSAEFKLIKKDGWIDYYYDSRKRISCWLGDDINSPRGQKILNGEALK
jgi:hypothetical protein